jgi:hypothetical protein
MSKRQEVLVRLETTTFEKSSLIRVELLCADCKAGKHGCAKAWRGLGLDIHCCCSCIDLSTNVAAEGSESTGSVDDSKRNQIKFEAEYSETLAAKPPRDLSRRGLSSEEKTRQTTLEEFYHIARGGVKDPNGN